MKINLSRIGLSLAQPLLILTLLSGAAAHADELSTQLGFHRIDAQSPTAIQSTADSVFEVRMPGGETRSAASLLDLTSPSLQNINDRIDRDPDLDSLGKVVAKKQVEHCLRDHLETHCMVSHIVVKATAFLAGGNGTILFTNAHVVDDYFKLLKAFAPKMNVSEMISAPDQLPIFLFDRTGRLVFDPYVDGAKIIKTGLPSALSKARGSWFSEDSDYVVIKIGQVLGRPLPVGQMASVDQNVWHVGYPACTGCNRNANVIDPALNRSRKDDGDSNGSGFYWTQSGRILSSSEAQLHIDRVEQILNLMDWDRTIFFEGDSQVGMSGGPILNQLGQVVGIYAGSKALLDGRGQMNVMSRGVRPIEFDLGRSFAEHLK